MSLKKCDPNTDSELKGEKMCHTNTKLLIIKNLGMDENLILQRVFTKNLWQTLYLVVIY